MFGPTKTVSTEEHIKIYQSTGIDVDGRLEHIGRMLPHVEYCARRSIEFIKELPGFRSLPMDDKIALFKSKCHYVFVQYFSDHSFPLLVSYRLFTDELAIITSSVCRLFWVVNLLT